MDEQPQPTRRPAILAESAHWQVMADLAQRAKLGQERYETPLLPHNGRDMLRDAYEEMLDHLPYLRLAMQEWDDMQAALSDDDVLAEILRGHGWKCLSPVEPPGKEESTPMPAYTLTLDEMATILRSSGYFVREGRLSDEDVQRIARQHGYVLTTAQHESQPYTPETIMEAAERFSMSNHGTALTRDQCLLLISGLTSQGMSPTWEYANHRHFLGARMPDFFPRIVSED